MMMSVLTRLLPLTVAGAAAAGGGDEIKGLASQATNAVLQLKTSMEMRGMVQAIRLDIIHGESPPTDLTAWLENNMDSQGSDPTIDAWGSDYLLVRDDENALYVVSCGPDETCDTDDDLRALIQDANGRFGSRPRRRSR